MIKHVVLLSFQAGVSEEEITAIFQATADLQKTIPQILSFSGGKNISPEGLQRGYMHGFIMEFADAAARDVYLYHPEHVRVAQEIIVPKLVDGGAIVFDYEY